MEKVMRNYLVKAAVAGCVCLLSACHTTTTSSNPMANVFSFSPPSAEANLAQSVQNALIQSGDPVIGQVRVQTTQNLVILSGYVKKIRQSDVAEQIARKVPGVKNVDNRIIVRR
ncbi:BON domain-containing protein [Legionella sp. km772]|nr:BON domain-containing protein [Legionella sp. km772]